MHLSVAQCLAQIFIVDIHITVACFLVQLYQIVNSEQGVSFLKTCCFPSIRHSVCHLVDASINVS